MSRQLRQRAAAMDVVDSHTCGQSTRVILNGAFVSPGADPCSARLELSQSRDWVRRMAVFEPRGHRSMFAAVLIEPDGPDGDYGVVFMDANGYPEMCGHATIGVATTLFELGLVLPPSPDYSGVQELRLSTPMGKVELRARIQVGRCQSVAFRPPLAYYLGSAELPSDGGGVVSVDVAYGGQWYAFLPAASVGLAVTPNAIDPLIVAAGPVRSWLAHSFNLPDPRTGSPPLITNVVWTGVGVDPTADARNVPISASGSFDRSPCGTATCARMAVLVAKGKLSVGSAFINEGILGTLYRGTVVAERYIDGVKAIVPEVEGSAWITSRAQLSLDERDPLANGFLIGNGAAVVTGAAEIDSLGR